MLDEEGVTVRIAYLRIKNFSSIKKLEIKDLEYALILVEKNATIYLTSFKVI